MDQQNITGSLKIRCGCDIENPRRIGFVGRLFARLGLNGPGKCKICEGKGFYEIDPISHFALPD
jgi:hypothetical protein